MLKELKFVMGAVAKKDFLPAMTHFRIEAGKVRSFNGTLALCSPIPFDIDCTPKADALVKAIGNCSDTITLGMTEGGKLRVQSGSFRAYIETVDGATPHVDPAGEDVMFDGEVLLKAFKTLMPFIGDDASRPWTNGILLRGQSAFVTNNVCLVEYWLGVESPIVVNIPREAVREMLRVDEPPIRAQIDKNSITFHYADERWIRSQLYETNWPDLSKVLDKPSNAVTVLGELFDGLEVIKAFADELGRVYIQDNVLRTHLDADIGATYEIKDGPMPNGLYQIKMLSLLAGVADKADFSLYPAPALFFGERLRGALIGMRL
jgi:DNA polymerase III sliding clamp (beta) subunit (PCNA family)